MDITTKQLDPHSLEAHVTLGADELNGYLRKAADSMAGEVAVEGFRKGHAPKHLAESKLNQEAVRSVALESALSESFQQAATKESWDIVKTTALKVQRNDEKGLEYSVTVHLWPAVSLAPLDNVKVPRKEAQATQKEVDEALDTVLNMRATFLDKTGPAVLGDRVEVDFEASVEGKPVDGGASRNHPLIIGGRSFMPGFEEQLVGLSAEMHKEFSLTAPDDYYEPKLAGKTVAFQVTVRRVQAVLKPELDDAFAKTLGKFETVSQLRDSLRDGILAEKNTHERSRLRLAILDAVIAGSNIPAPASMTGDELDEMLHRFGHDLQSRGIELGMYLVKLGKTEEQLRKDWEPEAQRQVRMMLVLRQVAKAQGISVSAGELDVALNETVAALIKEGQATEEQMDPERIRTALAQRMLRDKTLSFLEQHCAV